MGAETHVASPKTQGGRFAVGDVFTPRWFGQFDQAVTQIAPPTALFFQIHIHKLADFIAVAVLELERMSP
jgi:hypothetical protein